MANYISAPPHPAARRVYLSGPMSGLPNLNADLFNRCAAFLRSVGMTVANPAEINVPGTSWEDCMRADLAALLGCTEVMVLPGWQDSRGARLEVAVAVSLGMKVHDFLSTGWIGVNVDIAAVADPAPERP